MEERWQNYKELKLQGDNVTLEIDYKLLLACKVGRQKARETICISHCVVAVW